MTPDPRVPVLAGVGTAPAGWADLSVRDAGHVAVDCACCTPRGPLARALASLWFDATRAGRPLPGVFVRGTTSAALAALLDGDVLCAARFLNITDV